MLKIKFFASLRESLRISEVRLELDAQRVYSVQAVTEQLSKKGDLWQQLLADESTVTALNHSQCDSTAVVSDGDELAYFPPVTGG